ncbi:MAG: DUF1080 domain-containing protein [Verrucomicrobia bacterium]|nr:DUF1080 domain-containing protein [Verrucomicrobiota bacterium]
MLRLLFWIAGLLAAVEIRAAERSFVFGKLPLNETPAGFRSAVSGQGQPGQWKIILDETGSSTNTASAMKTPVLAQLSRDSTDEHFPLLIYDDETFGDFTLTTRFKNVDGVVEQMAGIAFRIQDENNYYYIRASSLGNTFRFFKLVNGQRSAPIGPEIEIPQKVWHELTIECTGNRIRSLLNGKELIPTLTDTSFGSGKIGFWTKSDSVPYFGDTKITYTPREILASALVREMMQRYPRLVGLRIFAARPGKTNLTIVASNKEKELGFSGGTVERDVIARDAVGYGKENRNVMVTLPLHDRNGETIAAAQVTMQSFKGQTEQNAIARAQPIVKQMQSRIRSAKDLLE